MRQLFSNFWVCLAFCLFLSCQAASSYTEGSTGWAWLLGIFALVWLNDARRALNRDKEDTDEPASGTEGR